MAGVIVGAKVPMVVVSRADTYEARLNSIAIASILFLDPLPPGPADLLVKAVGADLLQIRQQSRLTSFEHQLRMDW